LCFSATLFVRLRRSLAQDASLGANDIAVDSGGHSSSLAMVEQDSCSNAEQKGRKRARGGQSSLFGIAATAFESHGDGLAPRKTEGQFTVQPSVSTWMCSNAAVTSAPAIQLQKLGTLASRGIAVASLVCRPSPCVCCRVSLGGIVSCMHELLSRISSSHVFADAQFSLPSRARRTLAQHSGSKPRTSTPRSVCLVAYRLVALRRTCTNY